MKNIFLTPTGNKYHTQIEITRVKTVYQQFRKLLYSANLLNVCGQVNVVAVVFLHCTSCHVPFLRLETMHTACAQELTSLTYMYMMT